MTSDQVHTESFQSGPDKIAESPQLQPQLTSPDNADSLEFDHSDRGDVPAHYCENLPTGKETEEPQPSKNSIQHGEKEEESVQPLSLDAPTYRVSRLDSDIETHSVVSVQELTEMLSSEHSMPPQSLSDQPPLSSVSGKIPFSLPLIHPHTATQEGSAQTTPTSTSLPSHPTPQQTPSVAAKPWTPTSLKHTPPPLPSLQVASKLPQHLQLSPKLPPKGASPLPTEHTRESSSHSEISEGSSLLMQWSKNLTNCWIKAECLCLWKKGDQVVIR